MGALDGQLYAVNGVNDFRPMGPFPVLAPGPVTSIYAPGDTFGFTTYSVAGRNGEVAAGYTTPSFTGKIFLSTPSDGGVRHIDAPGNYSFAAFGEAWLFNSLGLDGVGDGSTAGIYALDEEGAYLFATFPASSASGYTAVTGEDVLVLGFAAPPTYDNFLYAVPPSTWASVVDTRTPMVLQNSTALIVHGTEGLAAVTASGTNVYLTRSNASYQAVRVERVPVQLDEGVVSTGDAVTVLEQADDSCTSILFTSGFENGVLVGVKDRDGERLIKVVP